MSSAKPLTISFRGLMVFHFGSEGGKQQLEVGVLPTEGHVFRVTTFRKGSAKGTPTPLPAPRQRNWRLDAPAGQGITRREKGEFKRETHGFDEDFRWIMDLEGGEFYDDDLTEKLRTSGLKPVIRVPGGDLYTKLLAPDLLRSKGKGEFKDFGKIAAVTACDITFEGEEVKLLDGSTEVFTFRKDPEVEFYEIRNTPPAEDEEPPIEVPDGGGHTHHGTAEDDKDHFRFYYNIFKDKEGVEKFQFKPKAPPAGGPAPEPNPQLCGKTMLGKRTTTL